MMRGVRRLLAVLVLAGAIVFVSAPADAQPVDLNDYFTADEIARADSYRGRSYALSLSTLAVTLAVTATLGLGAGSRALARWSRRRFRRWVARAAALAAAMVLIPTLITLPLRLGLYHHRRAFGLATDSPQERVRDIGLATGIELVVALAGALLVLTVARRLPRAWPLVVAPGAALISVVLVFAYPLVIEPAFNRFAPADPATRERVLDVARRASVEVDDVLIADASRRTTSLNAYVSGFGSTRRVVLYDTLVRDLPPHELELVVAHELGHEAAGDVLRGTAYAAIGVMVAIGTAWLFLRSTRFLRRIGADAAGDPAIVPFLALFLAVATLVATPVASAISRDIERKADGFALDVTHDPRAMIDLHVRLARANLADLDPNPVIYRIFFTHPSTRERIQMAVDAS
jgi:STE24 endopeptidase